MEPLAVWLEAHKERLVTAAIDRMTGRAALREQALLPVRAFFESLIQAVVPDRQEALEAVLRRWVAATTPDHGEPLGLLPVLSAIKHTIWQEYKADPPAEDVLVLAIQLDGLIGSAVECLVRLEAAALWEAARRRLKAEAGAAGDNSTGSVKDSFVAVAAHELKTPLTVIEAYANMLRAEIPDTANSRSALMLHGLQAGVQRLRELIDDLIDVSVIETGLLRLDLQPVWLRRLLDIAEFELAQTLVQRKLTLEIKRDQIGALPLIGDPTRLLQAFDKVLANAVKYTPDGGQITVAGREVNGFVEITVEDTGIGIAPENLERIFEKFSVIGDVTFHSSSKTRFKGGGPGLGLVIARGIIEAHGGTIWAESPGYDEDKRPGSRFHIMLPRRELSTAEGLSPLVAAAAQALAAVPDTASSGQGATGVADHDPPPPVEADSVPADRGTEIRSNLA